MSVVRLQASAEAGLGILSWAEEVTSGDGLLHDLADTARVALTTGGFRRLELEVHASDRRARHAALRAGFRQEGVRRAAHRLPDGRYEDTVLFARLADDITDGPGAFSSMMNSVLPRKRLIAHVVMRDDHGRILLCETTFKPDWELPGGIVEPGESAREAAVREVREELGIDLSPGPPLVFDWLPPYLGWDDAVEMIFDGGVIHKGDLAKFELEAREIRSVRLVTLDEAAELVTPLSHRRLSIALSLAPGEFAYLEDGRRA